MVSESAPDTQFLHNLRWFAELSLKVNLKTPSWATTAFFFFLVQSKSNGGA